MYTLKQPISQPVFYSAKLLSGSLKYPYEQGDL